MGDLLASPCIRVTHLLHFLLYASRYTIPPSNDCCDDFLRPLDSVRPSVPFTIITLTFSVLVEISAGRPTPRDNDIHTVLAKHVWNMPRSSLPYTHPYSHPSVLDCPIMAFYHPFSTYFRDHTDTSSSTDGCPTFDRYPIYHYDPSTIDLDSS